MLKNNIETFLECDKEYNEAEIVLFGAPFDSTTSFRPGTRFGSSAVRHESYGIAFGFTHLLSVFILYVSQNNNVFIWRFIK